MHIAQKFGRLLEAYRHPDGRKWSGQEIDDATGGIVTRSYITNLRKGRIENPGFEKLRAIAKAMGFPPELWFQENPSLRGEEHPGLSASSDNIAQKTNHLFDIVKNERTGEPYTNAEVSRMSLGDLTEVDLEGIRSGDTPNPSVDKVVALADVFGVHPSFFLDTARKPPVLDEETMDIFRDETVSAIAHKSLHLPDHEREMILGIIRQFEDMHRDHDDR